MWFNIVVLIICFFQTTHQCDYYCSNYTACNDILMSLGNNYASVCFDSDIESPFIFSHSQFRNKLIDCQGHKIKYSGGGSFALFTPKENVIIQNCFIEGYVYGIRQSGVVVYNNTFRNILCKSTLICIYLQSPSGSNNIIVSNITFIHGGQISIQKIDNLLLEDFRSYDENDLTTIEEGDTTHVYLNELTNSVVRNGKLARKGGFEIFVSIGKCQNFSVENIIVEVFHNKREETGIRIYNSVNVTLSNIILKRVKNGFYISDNNGAIYVKNSEIVDVYYGAYVYNSDVIFKNNKIYGGYAGIYAISSSNVQLQLNYICSFEKTIDISVDSNAIGNNNTCIDGLSTNYQDSNSVNNETCMNNNACPYRGEVGYCKSCEECTVMLRWDYEVVYLENDLVIGDNADVNYPTCIDLMGYFNTKDSQKTLDCNGYVLRNSSYYTQKMYHIRTSDVTSGITIKNCIFEDFENSFYFGSSIVFENNTIINPLNEITYLIYFDDVTGIVWDVPSSNRFVYLYDSDNIIFDNIYVKGTTSYALYLSNSENVNITNSYFINNDVALEPSGDTFLIWNNYFEGNQVDIRYYYNPPFKAYLHNGDGIPIVKEETNIVEGSQICGNYFHPLEFDCKKPETVAYLMNNYTLPIAYNYVLDDCTLISGVTENIIFQSTTIEPSNLYEDFSNKLYGDNFCGVEGESKIFCVVNEEYFPSGVTFDGFTLNGLNRSAKNYYGIFNFTLICNDTTGYISPPITFYKEIKYVNIPATLIAQDLTETESGVAFTDQLVGTGNLPIRFTMLFSTNEGLSVDENGLVSGIIKVKQNTTITALVRITDSENDIGEYNIQKKIWVNPLKITNENDLSDSNSGSEFTHQFNAVGSNSPFMYSAEISNYNGEAKFSISESGLLTGKITVQETTDIKIKISVTDSINSMKVKNFDKKILFRSYITGEQVLDGAGFVFTIFLIILIFVAIGVIGFLVFSIFRNKNKVSSKSSKKGEKIDDLMNVELEEKKKEEIEIIEKKGENNLQTTSVNVNNEFFQNIANGIRDQMVEIRDLKKDVLEIKNVIKDLKK